MISRLACLRTDGGKLRILRTSKFAFDHMPETRIEWWYFGLAGAMAILIALATVSFQAVKAALANPVKSLRSE
jgi:putative ABC transport system permease protein